MRIRKQTEHDLNELEVLFQITRKKTFINRPSGIFQRGDYKKSTAKDDVWIAEQKRIIVGFVSTYPQDNFIHNLFVHPMYQKQGIGKRLLQIAEHNLAKPMTLKIAMDNSAVCRFYEQYSWYQISRHDHEDEPYFLYKKD